MYSGRIFQLWCLCEKSKNNEREIEKVKKIQWIAFHNLLCDIIILFHYQSLWQKKQKDTRPVIVEIEREDTIYYINMCIVAGCLVQRWRMQDLIKTKIWFIVVVLLLVLLFCSFRINSDSLRGKGASLAFVSMNWSEMYNVMKLCIGIYWFILLSLQMNKT